MNTKQSLAAISMLIGLCGLGWSAYHFVASLDEHEVEILDLVTLKAAVDRDLAMIEQVTEIISSDEATSKWAFTTGSAIINTKRLTIFSEKSYWPEGLGQRMFEEANTKSNIAEQQGVMKDYLQQAEDWYKRRIAGTEQTLNSIKRRIVAIAILSALFSLVFPAILLKF